MTKKFLAKEFPMVGFMFAAVRVDYQESNYEVSGTLSQMPNIIKQHFGGNDFVARIWDVNGMTRDEWRTELEAWLNIHVVC